MSASSSRPNPDPGHILRSDGSAALGGEAEITVNARSDNPEDVVNIQWALNNVKRGGTIRLSGVFHFSDVTNNELVYSDIHVHQPVLSGPGPQYPGLPMYYVPGTVQRYVENEVAGPDPASATMYYTDPYNNIPLFPSNTPMAKIPIMVPWANDNRVFITGDVKIIGDGDATIRGGALSLTIGLHPTQLTHDFFFDSILNFPWDTVRWDKQRWRIDPSKTVDVTIEGIEFVDPLEAAIACHASTSLTIKDNEFRDLRGFDLANWSLDPGKLFSASHHPLGYFVLIAASGSARSMSAPQDLISGRVVITNNDFDARSREVEVRRGTCPSGYFEQQVAINSRSLASEVYCVPYGANAQLREVSLPKRPNVLGWRGGAAGVRIMLLNADVLVAKNKVINSSSFGLTCESNYGTTLIEKNYIEISSEPVGAATYSNAIWACDSHWSFEYGTSETVVTKNKIMDRNANGSTLLLADLDGAIVTKNQIKLIGEQPKRCSIEVTGSENSLVEDNRVVGRADVGIVVAGASYGSRPALDNKLTGNNLIKVVSDLTYSLDESTHSNTVRGHPGGTETVRDLNPFGPYSTMPNHITGATSKAGVGADGETVHEGAGRWPGIGTEWRDVRERVMKEFGDLRPR